VSYVLKSEDGRYVDYFGIRKKGPEYSLHPSQSEAIKMPDADAAHDVMTYFDGQGEPVRVVKLVPKRSWPRPVKLWALVDRDGDYMKLLGKGGGYTWTRDRLDASKFESEAEASKRNILGSYVKAVEVEV
jgi:hypothetical protein